MHVHYPVSDKGKGTIRGWNLAATKELKTIIFTEHNAVHDNFTEIKKEYANENKELANIPFPG